jgi:hypothetical protein
MTNINGVRSIGRRGLGLTGAARSDVGDEDGLDVEVAEGVAGVQHGLSVGVDALVVRRTARLAERAEVDDMRV